MVRLTSLGPRVAVGAAFVFALCAPTAQAAGACSRSPACWPAAQLRLTRQTDGAEVVVAVVDTGVAREAELSGRLLEGWSLVDGSADTRDRNGHGTQVAGIVAGRSTGVCASCRILPVRVADAHGAALDSHIAAGIEWAADHGARVVNVSLAGPSVDPALEVAVGYAVSKGALVVAAAGNAGSTSPIACSLACGGYPAAFAADLPTGLISVGATGADGRLIRSSNRGAWVMLAAPGAAIAPELDGSLRAVSPGTSYAAAYVSGLAGRALSLDPLMPVGELQALLLTTARQVAGLPVADGIADARRLLAAAARRRATQREVAGVPCGACRTTSARSARSARSTSTPTRGSARRRPPATTAGSAFSSSSWTTTTRLPTRASSSATRSGGSSPPGAACSS